MNKFPSKTSEKYQPKYPLMIISKGRWETRHTAKAFERLGVRYYIAVEPQEADKYRAVINPEYGTVLELPFSNHGKGSGPARNWIWEWSISQGYERHWCIDDNITEFWRFHNNDRVRVETGSIFRAMEDFTDRFENVALAGPQYKFFCPDNYHHPPVLQNTRLMSCILIKNDLPFRWRGKYNEDVDLSLRCLKAGYCTFLFYAFLQGKLRTGTVKGGNTTEIYGDGTFEKSKMLVNLHPDCVKLVQRYGRWHHDVDMRPFRNNELIIKPDAEFPDEPNEYGMKYVYGYGTDDAQIIDTPKPRKR
jgi:hypothetical protein